jgi:sugar phosphate isomerase/epimerase
MTTPTSTQLPSPLYSVSELTTLPDSFETDLDQYTRTGADGIGLWEGKIAGLPDAEALAAFRASGLHASLCLPNVWSLMPNPRFAEPREPAQRIAGIIESLERLAPFGPAAVMVTPGGAQSLPADEAHRIIIDGMRQITGEAARLGLRIALEPIRKSSNGFISSFGQALEVIEEVGADNLGVVLDIWHVWDDPELRPTISAHADRIYGVQVNDWRDPTRAPSDRVLPGEGIADVPGIIAALLAAGFSGWYDLEVMSEGFDDSLSRLPSDDLLVLARARFLEAWAEATAALE